MALASENVELVLQGLDQKTSAKLTAPGKLERARNVQFDKSGQLDKRDGYQRLATTQADGVLTPAVLSRLALDGDELVLMSTFEAWVVGDIGETLQGTTTRSLVRRGIVSSGVVSVFDVVASADGEAA